VTRYGARAMSADDLPRVRAWLGAPHVARWWPDADRQAGWIGDHLREPSMQCLILTIDGLDVGYLQAYDPHHEPCFAPDGTAIAHPYRDQPLGTRGIDVFIGEPGWAGQGHGPRLLDHVLQGLFAAGAPCVVTDPDPANLQSIAAFRKAGFRPLGERQHAWGLVLLMRRDNPGQAPLRSAPL
jgi:aminoglycoside 6'-N-acetyltransferase